MEIMNALLERKIVEKLEQFLRFLSAIAMSVPSDTLPIYNKIIIIKKNTMQVPNDRCKIFAWGIYFTVKNIM